MCAGPLMTCRSVTVAAEAAEDTELVSSSIDAAMPALTGSATAVVDHAWSKAAHFATVTEIIEVVASVHQRVDSGFFQWNVAETRQCRRMLFHAVSLRIFLRSRLGLWLCCRWRLWLWRRWLRLRWQGLHWSIAWYQNPERDNDERCRADGAQYLQQGCSDCWPRSGWNWSRW